MDWVAYEISPIDAFWGFLPTIEMVRAQLKEVNHDLSAEYTSETLKRFNKDWRTAQRLAKSVGWEGDIRGNPHVFWLPGDSEFEYGFAWKQGNNGTTYVVSPRKMDHLLELGSLFFPRHSMG